MGFDVGDGKNVGTVSFRFFQFFLVSLHCAGQSGGSQVGPVVLIKPSAKHVIFFYTEVI